MYYSTFCFIYGTGYLQLYALTDPESIHPRNTTRLNLPQVCLRKKFTGPPGRDVFALQES